MKLYIEVQNGVPVNHPAFEDNLLQAFGEIPSHWEPFVRILRPIGNAFQVVSDTPKYEKVDGVWVDVWDVRDMSTEEKDILIAEATAHFNAARNSLVEFATSKIAELVDLGGDVTEWEQYLAALNEWELQSVDLLNPQNPFIPSFPTPPAFNSN